MPTGFIICTHATILRQHNTKHLFSTVNSFDFLSVYFNLPTIFRSCFIQEAAYICDRDSKIWLVGKWDLFEKV